MILISGFFDDQVDVESFQTTLLVANRFNKMSQEIKWQHLHDI